MLALHVWDPFLAKDIKAIEDVQKFALRVCTKSIMALCLTLITMSYLTTVTYTNHGKQKKNSKALPTIQYFI